MVNAIPDPRAAGRGVAHGNDLPSGFALVIQDLLTIPTYCFHVIHPEIDGTQLRQSPPRLQRESGQACAFY